MAESMEWRFQQAFGDSKTSSEEAQDADIISSVEFDSSGNFLAIGDKGGRIVILQRGLSKKKAEYKVLTEFQSHESEFDYLKSLEIEEKINQIRWLRKHPKDLFLLSTNDKTIKLWKVYNKQNNTFSFENSSGMDCGSSNAGHEQGSTTTTNGIAPVKLPLVLKGESSYVHLAKKVFSNAHAYHINSISLNSDGETFLSSDDLRINLWHLNHAQQSLTVVDMKPGNMDDLTEVITSTTFHPKDCSTFLYSSSKGALKIGDLRQSTTVSSFDKSMKLRFLFSFIEFFIIII